jgi:hypothetical protein
MQEKKYNGVEHMRLKSLVLVKVSQLGGMAWNNPTGVFFTKTGVLVKVGVPGAADIVGETQHGRALAIEVKTGTGRLSEDQNKWRLAFESRGGLYIECRSLDDVKF